jgi:divalent metal cation (Fe/Co/Zn/Cd) transporter
VDGLLELLTMHLGPDHLIIAARVAFSDHIGADAVEDLSERIDQTLSQRLPESVHVFIDPTDTDDGSRGHLHPGDGAGPPAAAGASR